MPRAPADTGAAAVADTAAAVSRQRLIGTWRLVSIEVVGAHGPLRDPFYQRHSVGLIVYDASGWMSVQIGAPDRGRTPVPADRSARPGGAAARAAAAAFDSYYAYFGTWTLDAAHSTVTHHVNASLIPAETGLDYTQSIAFEGRRLIFTGRDVIDGQDAVRTKVWERVD